MVTNIMSEFDLFIDKYKGALLGCAVGDALGAPVEGLPSSEIKSRYGTVREYLDERFGAGRITDDTQMTVALAQAIAETGRFDFNHTAAKFGLWMERSDTGMKKARGVGLACSTACRRLYEGVDPNESGVYSAGCGAAMRVSPVGLRYPDNFSELKKAAVDQARLTHTDPEAIAGAVAVAVAVALGINSRGTVDPARIALDIAESARNVNGEMADKIAGLTEYLDRPVKEGLEYTGNGGYVMETVPCALLAFLKSPKEFEKTVVAAVNAGGDTDSTGAIAGAISGSFNGAANIPGRLLANIEGKEYLETLAMKLYTLVPRSRPKLPMF